MTDIKPALTAEEWELVEPIDYADAFHKLAALALYGQPFGFAREDVEALRTEARDLRVHAMTSRAYGDVEAIVEFERSHRIIESLARRIEALLPPTPTNVAATIDNV